MNETVITHGQPNRTKGRPEVKVGDTWNNLTIIAEAGGNGHLRRVECQCSCGSPTKTFLAYSIRLGTNVSCGCYARTAKRKKLGYWRKCKHGTAERSARMGVMNVYRSRAKKYNKPFTLDPNYFEQITSLNCVYCGAPPGNTYRSPNGIGTARQCTYSGLDRLDSSFGYEIGNVVPCCCTCNTAKNDVDPATFKAWLLKAATHALQTHWGCVPAILRKATPPPNSAKHKPKKFENRASYLASLSPLHRANDVEWNSLTTNQLSEKYKVSPAVVRNFRWRHNKPKLQFTVPYLIKRSSRRFVQSIAGLLGEPVPKAVLPDLDAI